MPSNLTEEQRKKLENEAKSWLQIVMSELAVRRKCALKVGEVPASGGTSGTATGSSADAAGAAGVESQLCTEMNDFLEHTYGIVNTSLDRHLYCEQLKVTNNLSQLRVAGAAQKQPAQRMRELGELRRLVSVYEGTNNLREVMKHVANYQGSNTTSKKINSSSKSDLTSGFSELIGESLLALLQKEPRRIAFVLRKLIGQQLTFNLRRYIWSDILMRHERRKFDGSNNMPIDIDFSVRKNFAIGVTRGKNELKLADPTHSPVANLIENAVIETYTRALTLNEHFNDKHMRQTMHILNVLYTYSRDYEPYFIYWLLPFQLTFNEEGGQRARPASELIYDLAMYLDLYVKNLFPSWTEIFSLAGKIVQDVAVCDPAFYDHLKRISKLEPRINPRDFVNEIIFNENKKRIDHVLTANDEEANRVRANKELLTEPSIFIRKWIAEGFSSVLRTNALLYVWDQLFMSLWSPNDFELIAKALLYLLKRQFLKASNHDEMRRVFLEAPARLYTSDIQSAYMHLSSGGNEADTSLLNKRDQEVLGSSYYARPEGAVVRKVSVPKPIGFRDFALHLIVPMYGPTSDFDVGKLAIEIDVYNGETMLYKKQTFGAPKVIDVKPSLDDTKTYELTLSTEKLAFNFAQLDLAEKDLNDSLLALIIVKYQNSGTYV